MLLLPDLDELVKRLVVTLEAKVLVLELRKRDVC